LSPKQGKIADLWIPPEASSPLENVFLREARGRFQLLKFSPNNAVSAS